MTFTSLLDLLDVEWPHGGVFNLRQPDTRRWGRS